jgi:hypothetical protein
MHIFWTPIIEGSNAASTTANQKLRINTCFASINENLICMVQKTNACE